MERLVLFEKYRNFEPINKEQLDFVIDFICGNLNSCFTNYSYWYNMYCYTTKSRIVIRHRESKNEGNTATFGECVCQGQIINFLENNNTCNCNKGCSSVYFNVVF